MTIFDLVADLLEDESPQNRPESPTNRPPEFVAALRESPQSPLSPVVGEKSESHRRWTLAYPGKDPEAMTVSPAETQAQVEARYPGVAVAAWSPVPPATALSDVEEVNVRAYLLAIGEDDQHVVAEVMESCWEDADAKAYWVGRATAYLLADDRRFCGQCRNLAGTYCRAASRGELIATDRRYRPPPDQPRRCEGYAPGPGDPDQRPGRERWPGLVGNYLMTTSTSPAAQPTSQMTQDGGFR